MAVAWWFRSPEWSALGTPREVVHVGLVLFGRHSLLGMKLIAGNPEPMLESVFAQRAPVRDVGNSALHVFANPMVDVPPARGSWLISNGDSPEIECVRVLRLSLHDEGPAL